MDIALFTMMTSAFITLTVYLIYRTKKDEKCLKKQGLQGIEQIKQLISLIQAHRGLSGALLSGNEKAKTDVLNTQSQISHQVKLIRLSGMLQFERWERFEQQWHDLLSTYKKRDVASSFELHTAVIKNLAWLLEDVAEYSHLTADFLPDFANIGFVWRELLQSTESIGQCRAIGTGVAVQKRCSSVDKIRLSYQIKVMQDMTENTLQNLSCLPEERASHNRLIEDATKDMNLLIGVISENLIKQSRVTLDSQDYFNLASGAMKGMYQIFDHQLKQLNRAI